MAFSYGKRNSILKNAIEKIRNYKTQIANNLQNTLRDEMMADKLQKPQYDLEERTFLFAKNVRIWTKSLAKSIQNVEDVRQLIRASGSVGANYIEANESLSKKDFIFRIKICKKEAKESGYWLRLILETNEKIVEDEIGKSLLQESIEIKRIFSSIEGKSR
jgi:four helix bundle protein